MSSYLRFRRLLSELRRRKVFHVLLAYLSAGVAVALAFAELYDDLGLPDWTTRFVLLLLILGLPIALVLAWAYELRPEEGGAPETEGPWEAAIPTGSGRDGVPGPDPVDPGLRPVDPGLPTTQPGPSPGLSPGVPPDVSAGFSPDVSAETFQRSIVVLPFDNLSPDPDQDYFCDGMTDEVIADLSGLHSLRVISRTSTMLLKGSGKDLRAIGRELSVRYVLEGSVRKAGDRLRVTAQLIDAETDAHLWAEKYDGELDDVFDIQESVARSIAEALRLELTPEDERAISHVPVKDTEAWECVLRARHEIWTGTENSIRKAMEHLQAAHTLVGENEAVLSALSEAEFMLPHVTGEGMEDLPARLREIANRILALDPSSPVGHLTKGLALAKSRGSFPESLQEFRRAATLDSSDPSILVMHAYFAALVGLEEEGLRVSERVVSLDPLSPVARLNRSFILFLTGNQEAAALEAERAVMLDPTSPYFRWGQVMPLAQLKRLDEVRRSAAAVRDQPTDNFGRMVRLYEAALQEHPLDPFLDPELLATAHHDETFSLNLAECMAQVGRLDEALDWLENALSFGLTNPGFLGERDVLLEPLRGEPRFHALLERARRVVHEMGLDGKADPSEGEPEPV